MPRLLTSLLALLVLLGTTRAQESSPSPPAGPSPLDIGRIRELHHLTDVLGDRLWPGFDTRKIPVAINLEDRQEILVGHSSPPIEYQPLEGVEVSGMPVLLRDGISRYGPRGGGWAVDIGDARAAYVSRLQEGQTTDQYLSLLLHECFHVFQQRIRQRTTERTQEPPEDRALQAALIGLESRILHAALRESDAAMLRELARMFVAVRRERRRPLSPGVVRGEDEQEYGEGTATYSQARMYQLLAESGGLEPVGDPPDPHYHRFAEAAMRYEEVVEHVLPPPGRTIGFLHAAYHHGMAQGLLLDRIRPDWKTAIAGERTTLFGLVEPVLPTDDADAEALLAAARERFAWDEILAEQTSLMEARLAKIRSFLEAPGRRYRIHHGALRGRFKWKPEGPVYRVPSSLLEGDHAEITFPDGSTAKTDPHATIWAGGIRRFERGDLVFESGDVPIIFRSDYLEWIDPEPAADGSDLEIACESREGDVYTGLRLTTGGFRLTLPHARIDREGTILDVHPLP